MAKKFAIIFLNILHNNHGSAIINPTNITKMDYSMNSGLRENYGIILPRHFYFYISVGVE